MLDVIAAFEKASGVSVPYDLKPRRAGDVPMLYADPGKAAKELSWKAGRDLRAMCADSWKWQSQNPGGY